VDGVSPWIKAELATRGPVACGIHVTEKFEAYTGGIYKEFKLLSIPNHELAIVGQGLTLVTFQLNVSDLCGTGGALRGCLGGVQGVSRVVRRCLACVFVLDTA
jgi:hypothetical protein